MLKNFQRTYAQLRALVIISSWKLHSNEN